LEKHTGFGSGHAMRLGAADSCSANVPTPPGPLPKGKYVVSAFVKGINLHGPGGYLDLFTTDSQYAGGAYLYNSTAKVLKKERHYSGKGSFDWQRVVFLSNIVGGAPAIAVGMGNAGTGDFLVTDLEIRPLKEGETPPAGIAAQANSTPPPASPPVP